MLTKRLNIVQRLVRTVALMTVGLGFVLPSSGQNLSQEAASLADRTQKVVGKKNPKIAVTDFTDLQGRPTELGRFLAEQLSVELVNAPGIAVVDRANLKSILAEHKLSEDGLINPENAKKLGKFAGVDAIIVGTVTQLDENLVLTIKSVATDTALIVAAVKATISRSKETQQLATRAVGSSAASPSDKVNLASVPLATRDFGDLRVTLTRIQRTRIPSNWGRPIDGIECDFIFTNRNLKEQMLCAANGQPNDTKVIRAKLQSTSGDMLMAAEVRGLTGVCVYGHEASAAAIAQTITTGQRTTKNRAYYPNERLWQGDLTSIPASESIHVAVVFAPDARDSQRRMDIEEAQLAFEFIVGTGSKKVRGDFGTETVPSNARLYTLSLDKLVVPQ